MYSTYIKHHNVIFDPTIPSRLPPAVTVEGLLRSFRQAERSPK